MTKSDQERALTATRILDVAERLVQVRGFNGFSYADISAELHVTKAALHYHFASKAELGRALIERYSARFVAVLADVEARTSDASVRLREYANLYVEVLRDHRMCLCGMMAADFETLPEPMQAAVLRYFSENQLWLSGVLDQGRESGTVEFAGSPDEVASMILGGFEGAMLIARPRGDVVGFESSIDRLLKGLQPRDVVAGPR